MNAFERFPNDSPSEEDFIRREEEAERFLERSTRERLAREIDEQDRYDRTQLVEENWVEVPEFAAPKPARVERMQMELSFEEVA